MKRGLHFADEQMIPNDHHEPSIRPDTRTALRSRAIARARGGAGARNSLECLAPCNPPPARRWLGRMRACCPRATLTVPRERVCRARPPADSACAYMTNSWTLVASAQGDLPLRRPLTHRQPDGPLVLTLEPGGVQVPGSVAGPLVDTLVSATRAGSGASVSLSLKLS